MQEKLIVFFSRGDENYVDGAMKYLETGNTERAAAIIHKLTGADLFKLDPAEPYPKGYKQCIERAGEEQRKKARPELKALPENFAAYRTIYLGYPNYWGTAPMPIFSFLEALDFSGKTIVPFCTHEGSGLGSSERDIKNACPGTELKKGLALIGSRVDKSEKQIETWLKNQA